MNRNGNPRLLAYWKARYRAQRAMRYRLGLTVRGTPRKYQKILDPELRRVIRNQKHLQRYHVRVDKLLALGLNSKGQSRKRNYPRHAVRLVNPFEGAYGQRMQAEQRRLRRIKLRREGQRRFREKNLALGLTTKGTPRRRAGLSKTELAWRHFRESLNLNSSASSV